MVHGYDLVLYHRAGWPVLLPQATNIGYGYDDQVALEWGSLLEDEGDDTAAQKVYKAVLELDPFLEEVERRLTK
jgi:hypothetical protein